MGSMRKTVDGGNTWPVVFTGNRGIFGIAIDPNHSDVVYFGTVGAGAFKSSSAGASWIRDVHSYAACDLDRRGRSGG